MGMECSLSVFRGCGAAASTSKHQRVEAIDGAAEIAVVGGKAGAAIGGSGQPAYRSPLRQEDDNIQDSDTYHGSAAAACI
jgi:hypothetical protein